MRSMSIVCLLTLGALFGSTPLRAAPVHDWSKRLGGTNQNYAYDVAVDGSGNVVIAGTFAGMMTIGSTTLTSAGSYDVFLAKFDANGAYQWCQRFGGTGLDGARAVAVDGAGNIVMTGYFRAPVSFGGAALAGRAALDIFVARFNTNGGHLWSQWYGSSRDDEGQDIAADASGNVVVTGSYNGAIDFAGNALPVFGSLDMFVLKLDAAGSYKWSKGAGSTNPDVGYGVAVDALQNVYVTGSFNGSVNFGGGALASAGSTDVFVVKYAGDGSHQWSTRLGGTAADTGYSVGADASGVVVTGNYNGAFLSKFDANGAPLWNQNFASSGFVQGLDLALSPAGAIAFTGNLQGTASFGGDLLTSAGDDDIFIAICDASGAHRWSQRFGNTGDDWGYGCAFDPAGNLVSAGIFNASVNFGGGALVSAGLSDVYMVKFDDEVVVVDTTPPVITCPGAIQVEQTTPGGTPATHPAITAFVLGASATDDTDPSPLVTCNAPALFPPGVTTVTFRAEDVSGNHAECTSTVTVLDTTPPQIAVELDKNALWPPNHKLVTVCATVAASDNGGEPSWSLVSITSSESDNGRGDGHTKQDIQNAEFGTPDRCFDLRAERAGNGDGRVYEIVYGASDPSGNATYDTVYVRVPHDMSDLAGDAHSGATALTSAHPNPFNPQTTLEYTLSSSERVQIDIYDARGALVRRLVDGVVPAGMHSVVWTGTDQSGRTVGSGIYFVRMTAGAHAETRKIVMLK
ncbi:MAG TPA: FlgD immunoglobulin-like domain containing protein [Candidatus Krumholzibacteria bacterium]